MNYAFVWRRSKYSIFRGEVVGAITVVLQAAAGGSSLLIVAQHYTLIVL